MDNTCRLWGQSFHLPTEVERKLKENWRLSVGTSIARPPECRSTLIRSPPPDRHLNRSGGFWCAGIDAG
ncbi:MULTISPECIES: hypothetical protein [unclassified Microcoleus]|uniref:hypothetical protein n=1 Tax=unclassified Microcoleus TaxID=2642155 RepID=UPI002FCE8F63